MIIGVKYLVFKVLFYNFFFYCNYFQKKIWIKLIGIVYQKIHIQYLY